MATQLEIIAEQQRQQHLSTNQYNYNQLYDSNNLNALSSNDEKGKGELNGNIGSKKDILDFSAFFFSTCDVVVNFSKWIYNCYLSIAFNVIRSLSKAACIYLFYFHFCVR